MNFVHFRFKWLAVERDSSSILPEVTSSKLRSRKYPAREKTHGKSDRKKSEAVPLACPRQEKRL
jgi:hypothetical protein